MEKVGSFPEAKPKGTVEQAGLWRSSSFKRSRQDWELIGESQPWEKSLFLRGKGKEVIRQIFIDFSWPIPKCLIWTGLLVSLYNLHQEGWTTSGTQWDRGHLCGAERRLGEKSLYHHDSRSVVSSLLTCPCTTPPQPSHKPSSCAWIGHLAASTSPSLPHALPHLGQTGQVPSNAVIPVMSPRNTSVGNWPVLPLSVRSVSAPVTTLRASTDSLFSGHLLCRAPGARHLLFLWISYRSLALAFNTWCLCEWRNAHLCLRGPFRSGNPFSGADHTGTSNPGSEALLLTKFNNPAIFHTAICTAEKVVYSAHYRQMSNQTFSIRNRTRLKLISK